LQAYSYDDIVNIRAQAELDRSFAAGGKRNNEGLDSCLAAALDSLQFYFLPSPGTQRRLRMPIW
jgi:hypothetical protein